MTETAHIDVELDTRALAVGVTEDLMPHLQVLLAPGRQIEIEFSTFNCIGPATTTNSIKITVSQGDG